MQRNSGTGRITDDGHYTGTRKPRRHAIGTSKMRIRTKDWRNGGRLCERRHNSHSDLARKSQAVPQETDCGTFTDLTANTIRQLRVAVPIELEANHESDGTRAWAGGCSDRVLSYISVSVFCNSCYSLPYTNSTHIHEKHIDAHARHTSVTLAQCSECDRDELLTGRG